MWQHGWRRNALIPPTTHQYLRKVEELALRSLEWEPCPCPSLAAALWRVAIIPHLGNTVELALME